MPQFVILAGLLSCAVLLSSQSCLKSQEVSRINATTHTESVTLSLPSMPTSGFSDLSWKIPEGVCKIKNFSTPKESGPVTCFPNGTLVLKEPHKRHSGDFELEVFNETGHCIFQGIIILDVQNETRSGGVSHTAVNNDSNDNGVIPTSQGNTSVVLFLLSACGSLFCVVIVFLVILDIAKRIQNGGKGNSQRGGSCMFFKSNPMPEGDYVAMGINPFLTGMRQRGHGSTGPKEVALNAEQVTADGAAEGVYVPMTYAQIKQQPEITLHEPQTFSQDTSASSNEDPRQYVYAQINFQSTEKSSAGRGLSPSPDKAASD